MIAKHPGDALEAFLAKRDAEESTSRIFGTNGWNDKSDAFRHFMWSFLLTLRVGQERAQLILDNHERRPGQSTQETDMDLFNNGQGIQSAIRLAKNKNLTMRQIEEEDLNLQKKGRLKAVNPVGEVPSWRSTY